MYAHKQSQWSLSWCGPEQPHTHTLKSHLQLKIQPTERLYCWHSETDRKRRTRKKGKTVVTEWIRRLRGSEARKGRRKRETDRKVKGKLWPQTLSLTFSPLKHKTASPTLSLRFQQLLNASPYWMKFPLGAFCSGPKDFMPLHNQIITNNDKSQNSGSLGVCSDKVPFVK